MNRKIIWSTLCLGIAVFTGTTVWSQQAPSVKESTGLGKAHFGLRQLHEEYQAYLAQPGSKAPSFKSSNSFIRQVDGHVAVDIVAADPNSLIGQLQTLGMKNIAVYKNMASGLLPLEEIANIVAINEVRSVRPVLAKTNVGSVTSQGDPAMMSDDARAQWNIDGTGITVGTLSDSYNDLGGASADVASNDLPSGVTVLADLGGGGTDEGRAMMQLIHDVAPGVDQAFHTAFLGQADFALGIEELAGCPPGSAVGCTPVAGVAADVIVDDIIYFAEPMFQDGIIAQAVDHVKANGVAYFSAAGNSARQSFESFGFAPSGVLDPIFGTELHAFDGASDAFQSVTIPVGGAALMVLQWDQPFFSVSGAPGSTNDLDLFLFDSTGSTALTGSVISNVGGDPVEIFQFINDGSFGTEQFNIGISLFSGPAPGILKYVYFGDIIINEYDTQSSTIYGHANALGAEAVGAAFYLDTPDFGVSPPILEPFSSVGYTDIRFDTAGNAVYSARDKPDIVAPDGADTTFFFAGIDPEPNGFPNFFGTSAAAPHAAGAAALLLECNSALTPDGVYNLLESTAIDMFTPGYDLDTGYGLVNAVAAANIACTSTGNAQDLIGTYWPEAGQFYLDIDGNNSWTPGVDIIANYGASGDLPVAGDWNGDGDDEIGVYRPGTGQFFLDVDESNGWTPGVDAVARFGAANDLPTAGDWNGDGDDNIGVYRSGTRQFFLDSDESDSWTPGVDTIANYGTLGLMPVAGKW